MYLYKFPIIPTTYWWSGMRIISKIRSPPSASSVPLTFHLLNLLATRVFGVKYFFGGGIVAVIGPWIYTLFLWNSIMEQDRFQFWILGRGVQTIPWSYKSMYFQVSKSGIFPIPFLHQTNQYIPQTVVCIQTHIKKASLYCISSNASVWDMLIVNKVLYLPPTPRYTSDDKVLHLEFFRNGFADTRKYATYSYSALVISLNTFAMEADYASLISLSSLLESWQ